MRRIMLIALIAGAPLSPAFAQVYPYVASTPVYVVEPAVPQQYAAPQQYYVYAPRYGSAPAAVAPQAYAAPAPQAAPPQRVSSSPGGGGFLEAIFGGPTIDVPVSHVYTLLPTLAAPPPVAPPQPIAPAVASVAANPSDLSEYPIDPRFMRQVVAYHGDEQPGTIIVDTPNKFLYLVEDGDKAMRYGIGVGRPGFTWSGVHSVTAKKEWPDWTPPPEMLDRQPGLPRFMPGGLGNPLGARALYLGSTLYRIHGSNEPWTIGTNVSSGCIRMRNADVEDLYDRVKVGTKVVVM